MFAPAKEHRIKLRLVEPAALRNVIHAPVLHFDVVDFACCSCQNIQPYPFAVIDCINSLFPLKIREFLNFKTQYALEQLPAKLAVLLEHSTEHDAVGYPHIIKTPAVIKLFFTHAPVPP